MTSKERAELRSKAQTIQPIYSIGKEGITPTLTDGVRDAIHARELIKINVLKNCDIPVVELANTLAERTSSAVVQVIGRKIVLYKLNPELEKKRNGKLNDSKSKPNKKSNAKSNSKSNRKPNK
ncbi:MAG: YhbY family RNA-binding protein [Lachnospiraceae bacterium]|nr:YhbY family RNA-binding protein [Lachnospiraceae bacterium]